MSTPDDIHNPTSAGNVLFIRAAMTRALEQEQPAVTGGLTSFASTF